jgi:hypothetical protein
MGKSDGTGELGKPLPQDVQDLDAQVKSNFSDILSGAKSRLDDKTVGMMKQGLFETTRGGAKNAKRSLKDTLTQGGILRGGLLARGGIDIDNAANAQFTKGVREIMLEKAKVEWEDKSKALDQAQAWLTSKRQYDIGLKQVAATIKAAQIQASATVAAAGISASATKAAARAGAGAARYAADQRFQLGMGNLQHANDSLALQAAALGLS